MLPAPGPVRTGFLTALGVPTAEHATFHVSRPCINVDFPTGGRVGPPENQGNVLGDPRQLMPHSISSYLDQLWGSAPDRRGRGVLRPVTGPDNVEFLKPTVLNALLPQFRRTLYNVIPTDKENVNPWTDVFVSNPNATPPRIALICEPAQVKIIQNHRGFGVPGNCGVIAAGDRSP